MTSNFVPVQPGYITWKCPKCGAETISAAPPNPMIKTSLPLLGLLGKVKPPRCQRCDTKMRRS